jgi:hypothetical protein
MCIKILIPIYKIVSHISNFFSDKSNHNKIYDNYLIFLNKMNDQTLTKKPIVTIIIGGSKHYFMALVLCAALHI